MITGHTRLAAVIGSPVQHSLSPTLHNAAFAAAQLDWAYVAFEVAPGNAGQALDAMRSLQLGGLNITMPHKGDVAGLCDSLSASAQRLQSVNTVVPIVAANGTVTLHGESTDGDGFIDSLADESVFAVGKRCVVVGAGGAGRAVALALRNAGAESVTIVNRSFANAQLAADLTGCVAVPMGETNEILRGCDLIVNASSVGMTDVAQSPIDPTLLGSHHVIAELIYHPSETTLMRHARASGATVVGGIGMLIYQGARSFEMWTGVAPSIGAMKNAALSALAQRTTS